LPNSYYAGVWAVEEILCVEPMVPPRHLEAVKGDGSVNTARMPTWWLASS